MTSVRAFPRLLLSAHERPPQDVVAVLQQGAADLGATGLVLYLVDYEQVVLQPDPGTLDGAPVPPASVAGTMAGRCFTTQTVLEAPSPGGGTRLWVPVSERAQRLGVLTLVVPELDADLIARVEELGLLAALLVVASSAYTDRFHLQRRRRDLDLAAEMQWSLLPPLSFSSGGTSVSGLLEPAYEVGGDCFDYALNDDVLDVAVFDAMGHGLASSVLAGLATGAYRHSRRRGTPLAEVLGSMDDAVAGLMGDVFVTALATRLDVRDGRLSWLSAGHPGPLVVRDGSVVTAPVPPAALPLGLGLLPRDPALPPTELALQPGDRVLLYTDGVVEARSDEGEEFGLDRLVDLFVRESSSGLLASEVLRRLVLACLDFQGGRLRDDATLVLVEWNGPDEALVPHQSPR